MDRQVASGIDPAWMLDGGIGSTTRREWKGVLGLMRNGRREVLFLWSMLFLGATAWAAPFDNWRSGSGSGDRVGMTVELRWNTPGSEQHKNATRAVGETSTELSLGTGEGGVSEVIAWPPETTTEGALGPRPDAGGSWQLGPGEVGRVRARLEVSPGAELIVRRGTNVVRIPVAAILERPQHTPAQSPLAVSVERLPWDSLMLELGQGAESGVVAPSALVPLSVKYNILWPEAGDVNVRSTAVLRPMNGGEPLWRDEKRESLPANQLDPPAQIWTIPAPKAEGTYVLELHATWEPAGARDGSRLGRLIRRRKSVPVSNSATRRVVFAVVSPRDQAPPGGITAASENPGRETEVDALDLGRIRNTRFSASGRSPGLKPGQSVWALPPDVLIDASRKDRDHDRLRSWIRRSVSEAADLGPADDTGLAWSVVGLRLSHPHRLHRLTVTVASGDPSALGVAVVDPGGAGQRRRVLLDACASGPPISKEGPPATFSWLVWPDIPEPLLVLLNRNTSGSVRLGTVKLIELESLPSPPLARVPATTATRTMGLYLADQQSLDRFGGMGETGLTDALEVARNLASYLTYCGASLVVLPERLSARQVRRGLRGQADENPTSPDQLDLVLRILRRQGYSAWLELSLEGRTALPGLPPLDSAEALRQGLVRVDRQGLADGPAYHPLHPDVRQAMKRRIEEALAPRGDGAPSGLLIQLGPGPTLLGTPDTGMDDFTFARFVHDTFGPETVEEIPGLGTTDPNRFAARSKYLSGVGRMPWLTWRSRAIATLYAELAEAARRASPGVTLALTTPVLHGGVAGAEARRVDLAGLAPSQAWRSVGLDLQTWPTGAAAPIVLRGVELSTDPLAHDLATSPDLDAKLASQPHRGMLLMMDPEKADLETALASRGPAGEEADDDAAAGADPAAGSRAAWDQTGNLLTLSSLPRGDGIAADEPLGHALAAIDAHWVILAVPAIAGHEERVRRFSSVLRALPASPSHPVLASGDQKNYGVAVRTLSDPTQTFLEIANDTPYPIRLAGVLDAPATAPVEDLGRNLRLSPQSAPGGRQLVIDLLPFGVSAIRVGAPKIQITEITPYPSEAVLTSMEARYRELSIQLARLNRGSGSGIGEPPNSGFEPDRPPIQQTQNALGATSPSLGPVGGGWKFAGGAGCVMGIDTVNPHSGNGSLKLTAPIVPASVTSPDFVPSSASSMTIQAYLRSEPPDVQVRLRIEGEVGGQPYLRRTEFTVPAAWELKAVRATDLPAGGLDSARLRLEMISPGTLWIDDLHLVGETTPKAVRLNAQRTLLAALQAYRAQHYAEFARLSTSHWARHPSVLATNRLNRPSELSETASPGRPGPAAASALSPERRLR